MNGLLDYQCQVYESGYEIVAIDDFLATSEVEYEIESYLRPINPKSPIRGYNLMDHPGVFYEFAEIFSHAKFLGYAELIAHGGEPLWEEMPNDRLIKFVNKYGLLTYTPPRDSLYDMYTRVSKMAYAVFILKLIQQSDIQGLKEIFHKTDGNFICNFIKDDEQTRFEMRSSLWSTPPQNELDAAYGLICLWANKQLEDCISTRIFPNSRNTATEMSTYPKDMNSALWLQLAHAVSRNLEFKQCAACSTFFEVKSKKRKNEKIYCSDRCRVRVGARKRREKEKAK